MSRLKLKTRLFVMMFLFFFITITFTTFTTFTSISNNTNQLNFISDNPLEYYPDLTGSWYDFPPGVEETHLGEQWIRTNLFTTGGGETGCCFLAGNVLVISRNGGWGDEEAKQLEFNFYYPNGTVITFNHIANVAEGEEQWYGSYAITNGARFGSSMNRLIISNGYYCDGDIENPLGTYGVSANWHYNASYKFGSVHGWSSFPLIGANVPLLDDYDKQDIVTSDGVTYVVSYGNNPSHHSLHIGKHNGSVYTEDLEGLGATWP
ncbi:MAG: hypothetical protein ACXQS8_03850, partial [Candidatus Helarchaeales archaeon]